MKWNEHELRHPRYSETGKIRTGPLSSGKAPLASNYSINRVILIISRISLLCYYKVNQSQVDEEK